MTRIRIERSLPAPGEILVRTGEWVEAAQRVAHIPARGEFRIVNVARTLGLDDQNLSEVMVKRRDERVQAGEVIATRRGRLPFWHKPCRSPIAGRLAAIGHGWVVVEAEGYPSPTTGVEGERGDGKTMEMEGLDLLAFVSGKVVAVANQRRVTIETAGVYIEGACGLGGEASGVLHVLSSHPAQPLTADDIGLGSNNAILVGGAGLTPEALERARQMQARGIIVGGMPGLLHDLVAGLPFPVVATEGYGNLSMSAITFDILKRLEGYAVSISGEMGPPWNRTRPLIVVPLAEHQESEGEFPLDISPAESARVGEWVRVVRHPWLGQVGQIVAWSGEPRLVPAGYSLPCAQVTVAGPEQPIFQLGAAPGPETISVPWLNLERLVSEARL